MIPGLSRRLFVGRACALAANSAIAVVSHWARAQQPESPRRIGVLLAGLSPGSKEAQQLRDGLQDAGYSEGRDLVIDWRTAGGDFARLPKLAAELVQRKVEVIVATGTVAAQAAKRATSTIPIVITVVADPVGSGLVTSFAHPGGNVTGVSNMAAELSVKRLQLLKEAIPRLARVAVLWNPDTPSHTSALKDLKAAATPWAIELNLVSARNPEELKSVLPAMTRAHAEALQVLDDALFLIQRVMLVKLASTAHLPAIYGTRDFPEEGGLMSYGANLGDLYRRSAIYVSKILKGANAGDLPIEQPTKFELIVNMKTAKRLGLSIPQSVLIRADEVIN